MRWNHKHTNANTQIQRYTNTQIKSVSVPHVLNLSSQLQFAKLHSNRMLCRRHIMRSNVCIWELLSLIVFVFVIVFIVMHNGLSCQCVSVVPAGGAIFGEAVRRHKPAPCNQLYFYFLYFVFVCWFFLYCVFIWRALYINIKYGKTQKSPIL